jgi:WD40 repeat protein
MRRHRTRLVAAAAVLLLALLGWLGVLRTLSKPLPRIQFVMPPRYTIPTGHVAKSYRKVDAYPSVVDIIDDGSRVIVGVNWSSTNGFGSSEFEIWDTAANRNVTPKHWSDPDWKEVIAAPRWFDSGLAQVVATPDGRKFACDGDAWAAFRERLTKQRSIAFEKNRPTNPYKGRTPFPKGMNFSPDGRFIAYVVSNGVALEFVDATDGDGTVVEDVATGKRVATLAGLTEQVMVAPGGRTAVSFNHQVEGEGEQPRMVLWDLESSSRRAGLLIGDYFRPCEKRFSEDGRYVFVHYSDFRSNDYHLRVRWWDTTSGKKCGEVVNCDMHAFIDGGRVLVTHPRGDGGTESGRILFWDVATGQPLGEWNLNIDPEHGGHIGWLIGAEVGQFLIVDFDPPYPTGLGPRPLQGVVIPKPPPKEPRHAILLDVGARREVGCYVGGSPQLSRDGRWLATVDDDGIVRVWEVPQ